MEDKTPKHPGAKLIGISIAFLGILYLHSIKTQIQNNNIFILKDFVLLLPSIYKILAYWAFFSTYLYFWYREDTTTKIIRSIFWAHFIALLASWTLLIYQSHIALHSILPYLQGTIARQAWPTFWSWITYFATFFISNFCISFAYGFLSKQKIQNEILVRGKSLIDLSLARDISATKIKSDGPGVTFGWLQVPESQVTTHFAVVGATGSGKTLLIRTFLESVLPRIKVGRDCRALIYDAKRDMLPILTGMDLEAKIITLHPFDRRGASWDMAKDITSPASADQMSSILIPQEPQSSNPFFTDAARALMTGVLTVFIKKCKDTWTFRDLIFALKSGTRLKALLSECEETKDLIEQYFSNERTANDVMSTIATKIQRYQYIAAAWDKSEKKVSLKDWVNSEYILVLGNDEETRSAVDALNQVIFKRITELILNQSESFTRRSWIVLDELKEAGMLPGLTSLLSKGRSKGASVVLGFQDIEGLSAALKDSRVANEIVGLCANKAILRLDSAETAKWASMQFGDQEVEQRKQSLTNSNSSHEKGKSTSTSSSESWVNHKKQAVMPVEFLDLPPVTKEGNLHGFYIIPSIGSYSAAIRMSDDDSILSNLKPQDTKTPGYLERSKEDQYLRPWDSKDLERLNLSTLKISKETLIRSSESEGRQIETTYQEQNPDPLDLIKRW